MMSLVRVRRLDGQPVRIGEPERAVIKALHVEPAFVHQPVMGRTKEDEIVQRGLAAVGPVLDVMAVEPVGGGAAGEAAPAVAVRERAAYRRRDAAGTAPDAERFAIRTIHHGDDAGIAAQPSGGLCRDGGAVLNFAASRPAVGEHFGLDMNHDLVVVGCERLAHLLIRTSDRPSTPAHRRGARCATVHG